MGISEILQSEQGNSAGIVLYKEGIFFRAYEESAYLFINHIKAYSITKKYYKNVKQEVVYIGFPLSSFSNIENIWNKKKLTIQKGEKQISISGFERFNLSDFERWKNSIENTLSQNN